MILAKAPLRVSFFGGGSDIPAHYLKYGGATLSTAIDKYVYVAVSRTPHNHIKLSYSEQELVTSVDEIKNDIIRNALKMFDISGNIDISTFADLPTVGSGLAGSSAFTCALIRALSHLCNQRLNEYEVAEMACTIEIEMCGWNIGKQDQYASAFGGMNYIQYQPSGAVTVTKLDPHKIDKSMLLIPTNVTRHAAEVLDKIDFDDKATKLMRLADYARQFSTGVFELELYGEKLDASWEIKKQLEGGISSPEIDAMYNKIKNCGAAGAKLLGAGGGGYMLALTSALDKPKLHMAFSPSTCLDVRIAHDGAKVVYND